MPLITLREITKENLREAARLNVAPGQENFVAPNAYSVAQSKFYPTWAPLAIYAEDTMVGFLMYGRDEDGDQDYWLIRLMVDKQYPRRGYGRLAMLEAPGRDIRGSRAGGLLKV